MSQTETNANEDFKSQLEKEARILAEQEESDSAKKSDQLDKSATITSLGKAEKFNVPTFNESDLGADLGWKNVPIENLPETLSHIPGTQIAIRSATVAEIRHWSTIDDNDLLGIDDMLNFIMEKCVRVKIPGKPGSYKDICEINRLYLIFAVRDFTFKNGENKIYVTGVGEDGSDEKIEVTKDVIDYFKPDERLMKYYDADERCFKIQMKNGESFNIYLPTLGVVQFIKSYLNARRQGGQSFDKAFTKYAPFLFPDWRLLNQSTYEKAVQNSYSWSIQRISVMDKIVEMLSQSIKPQVRYNSGAAEVTAPLNFPAGIKSLFLISDIFGELV